MERTISNDMPVIDQGILQAVSQYSFSGSPLEGNQEERGFAPVSAKEFVQTQDADMVDWVWEDYLPTGGLALLAAKPKTGKTTLAYRLAAKVATGEPFLGRPTSRGGVLIFALEEHPRDVRARLRSLGANYDNLFIQWAPLAAAAQHKALKRFVEENGIHLIIIDTLGMFWSVDDESDASKVTQNIKLLLDVARSTDACVLLIHHFRKSEGKEGDEVRGSSALMALVDIALLLYAKADNQRSLKTRGRYADSPPELIIALVGLITVLLVIHPALRQRSNEVPCAPH